MPLQVLPTTDEQRPTVLLVHEEVRSPLLVDIPCKIPEEHDMVRTNGAAAKMHFRLAGGPVPFSVVASDAGRHEILPTLVSPACLRLDMVHGQRDVGPAAILASVPVAPEHVLPGKDNSLEGYSHEDRKPNDAGQRHRA